MTNFLIFYSLYSFIASLFDCKDNPNKKKMLIISVCIFAFFLILALIMLGYSALENLFYMKGYEDGFNYGLETTNSIISLML